jgi:hypothetical protein
MSLDQLDPSAQAPWTSTIFFMPDIWILLSFYYLNHGSRGPQRPNVVDPEVGDEDARSGSPAPAYLCYR